MNLLRFQRRLGTRGVSLIEPDGVPTYDIINPKITWLWGMAFDVRIPGVIHLLPSDREQWRILLHDGLGLPNHRLAFGRIEFVIHLPDQGLEGLIVPFGIILRPLLHIPGIKVVSGIEQGGDNRTDRDVKITGLGFIKPHLDLHWTDNGINI